MESIKQNTEVKAWKFDKWNEEQEDYDAYIYVHEYKVVA